MASTIIETQMLKSIGVVDHFVGGRGPGLKTCCWLDRCALNAAAFARCKIVAQTGPKLALNEVGPTGKVGQ